MLNNLWDAFVKSQDIADINVLRDTLFAVLSRYKALYKNIRLIVH